MAAFSGARKDENTLLAIQKFLNQDRIAVVGVSRNPNDFSRVLLREFMTRGYEVLPINPNAKEIEGKTCYPHLRDIHPPVYAALLMTPPQRTGEIVRQCLEEGIRSIWIYGIFGSTKVDREIARYCEANELSLIAGFCPFMFFPNTAFYHRCHTWIWKALKLYPQ